MIAGSEYDIFISYSHADDLTGEESESWVTQLGGRLRGALGMRLGASKDLTIFMTAPTVWANTRLPQFLEAVPRFRRLSGHRITELRQPRPAKGRSRIDF